MRKSFFPLEYKWLFYLLNLPCFSDLGNLICNDRLSMYNKIKVSLLYVLIFKYSELHYIGGLVSWVVGLIIGGQIAECEESNPPNRAHCFGIYHPMVMHKTDFVEFFFIILANVFVSCRVLIFLWMIVDWTKSSRKAPSNNHYAKLFPNVEYGPDSRLKLYILLYGANCRHRRAWLSVQSIMQLKDKQQ